MSAVEELGRRIESAIRSDALWKIGEPDCRILAQSVLVKLLEHRPEEEGWILRNGSVFKIEDVRDTWEDDGHRTWDLVTEDENPHG